MISRKQFKKFKLSFSLLLILLLPTIVLTTTNTTKKEIKVAVIGSGIGGSYSAYNLLRNEINPNKNTIIHVDLYEKNKISGGRIYSENIDGNLYNLGASFFIKENELLYNLLNELKVKYEPARALKHIKSFGLFKSLDKPLIWQLSGYKYIQLVKVLWRYGLSPYHAENILDKNLKEFLKIYDVLKQPGRTISSLGEFLDIINLRKLISESVNEYLISKGVGKEYIEELLAGIISSIYNQNHNELNAFAGFITLAGISLEAMEIEGGNDMVVRAKIVKLKQRFNSNSSSSSSSSNSRFNYYNNEKVTEIEYSKNEKVILKVSKSDDNENGKIERREYDYVIIAVPLLKSGINIVTDPIISRRNKLPSKFQQTYVTVVKGEFNPEFIQNITGGGSISDMPNGFLSVDKKLSDGISEIGLVDENTYKIQSDDELTHYKLTSIFKRDLKILKSQKWEFAYPKLIPVDSNQLPDFEISKRIYHLNAMELAASCMELSMISGMNIVKLIYKDIGVEFKYPQANNNQNKSEEI